MEEITNNDVVFDNPKKKTAVELYGKYFGNISKVCKKLEISRNCFYEWKHKDSAFKKAIDSIDFDSYIVDLAEQQMLKLIKGHTIAEQQLIITSKGTIQKTITKQVSPSEKLIVYVLENKGKNRGYAAKEKDGEKTSETESNLEKRERILLEMLERAKQEKQEKGND